MKRTTKWTKVFSVLLAFSLILIFTWSIQGQTAKIQKKGGNGKGGGKPDEGGGYLSVSVTFLDAVDYRIKSDLVGTYYDATNGVLAIVGVKEGGFRLDTNMGRSVYMDFTDVVILDDLPLLNGLYDVDLRLGEEFVDGVGIGTKLDIVELDGGQVSYGALSINFTPLGAGRSSKLLYRLVFGSLASGWPTCTEFRFPVKVERGGELGAPENSWTISATTVEHACLWEITRKKAHQIGFFRMPFSIEVVEIQ